MLIRSGGYPATQAVEGALVSSLLYSLIFKLAKLRYGLGYGPFCPARSRVITSIFSPLITVVIFAAFNATRTVAPLSLARCFLHTAMTLRLSSVEKRVVVKERNARLLAISCSHETLRCSCGSLSWTKAALSSGP